MRLPRLLTAAALLGGLIVLSGQPAFAADCAEGAELKSVPWAQKMLPPEKVAPFATGKGVVVATLDTGAAASHVQLDGHVLAGTSFVTGKARGRGDTDCVGHGTGIASLIVGQGDSPATGFRGLAPDATILPVKVTEGDPKAGGVEGENTGGERVDARGFAAALDWAVAQGADVVNMSLKFDRPDDAIENAIAAAVKKGVVLVASGGNDHSEEVVAKTGVDTVSYPVGYDGVIGVGAVTAQGVRSPESEIGPWIDVVAPGENVHFATPDGKYGANTGTSLSAAFVSATAALVIEAYPELRGPEVAARILATASPAPGGMDSLAYGAGIVDPYRAVTDDMPGDTPRASMAPMEIAPADPAELAAAHDREVATDRAMLIGAVLAVATILVLAVVGALRRGRRRGWRAGRKPIPDEPDEPDDGAPIALLRDLKL
ncbi:S8 family serine peptidase [Phytomonospora endophytica]|uniref:Type VII secretion-associated serine protease mycosin n=1 Tax=Phytomonospora endophytica TaxID=714109 RepID=A0A841FH07_9ACTN|nr:S8 family serine peptidase [Phytomonospora endophytica]MBB6032842.1 type VII secretion-associated serine protease mycosin [Phytomonospora endophytica]GIG65068.1 type VII secretion-associated serine protease [Phytomonospora endophytica]